MSVRLYRIDRIAPIHVRADAEYNAEEMSSTVRTSPARKTREGYLEVDAIISRDGILNYSDGDRSWREYRPRDELEAAADSWQNVPITDSHPKDLVDAESWREVARGVVMSRPVLTGPEVDGHSYLRARLLVTDAELISKIEGGQHEVSVGFAASVTPVNGLFDGRSYEAIQTVLVGNHVASVEKGRAGSNVRMLLDSADKIVPVCTLQDGTDMKQNKSKTKVDAEDIPPVKDPEDEKGDEVGAPTDMIAVAGPDGTPVDVPTWVANELAELARLRAGEPEVPPAPVAPAAPAAPAAPVVPAAPPMTADSMRELVRARVKLETTATACGIPRGDASALDTEALQRAIVTKLRPGVAIAGYRGDALAALVDVLSIETDTKSDTKIEPASTMDPWQTPMAVPTTRTDADEDKAEAAFLKAQGY